MEVWVWSSATPCILKLLWAQGIISLNNSRDVIPMTAFSRVTRFIERTDLYKTTEAAHGTGINGRGNVYHLSPVFNLQCRPTEGHDEFLTLAIRRLEGLQPGTPDQGIEYHKLLSSAAARCITLLCYGALFYSICKVLHKSSQNITLNTITHHQLDLIHHCHLQSNPLGSADTVLSDSATNRMNPGSLFQRVCLTLEIYGPVQEGETCRIKTNQEL